jgi:hypothetical protein
MVLTDDKVFPEYDVLGWYSNVSDIQDSDMLIHKALTDTNESTVYFLFNPPPHCSSVQHQSADLGPFPSALFLSLYMVLKAEGRQVLQALCPTHLSRRMCGSLVSLNAPISLHHAQKDLQPIAIFESGGYFYS